MNKAAIISLSDDELRAIAASTSAAGRYSTELDWALRELRRRRLAEAIDRLRAGGPINLSIGG